MIKKAGFLGIILLVFCGGITAETIRMAIFQLEPFLTEAGETTEPGGITVDYWRNYIAPRMEAELEVIGPLPYKRAEKMLETGEVDIIPNLTITTERQQLFLYSETHLTTIQSCLSVLPDYQLQAINSQTDLLGMHIVFMAGAYIPSIMIHEKISFDLVSNEDYRDTFYNMLFARRVDAALDINYLSLLHFLRNRGIENRVRIILLPEEPVKVYSVFTNSERGWRLRKAFDEINRQGLAEGIFQRMVSDYVEAN